MSKYLLFEGVQKAVIKKVDVQKVGRGLNRIKRGFTGSSFLNFCKK